MAHWMRSSFGCIFLRLWLCGAMTAACSAPSSPGGNPEPSADAGSPSTTTPRKDTAAPPTAMRDAETSRADAPISTGGMDATVAPAADAGSADSRSADAAFADASTAGAKMHIIIDSDANNEVDDQHAIAYALFSSNVWVVDGVTSNRTEAGGAVANHTAEALRVVKLCASDGKVPVFTGANGDFNAIKGNLQKADHDGHDAVDFIIKQAKQHTEADKLVVIAIGKITNVALALTKDKSISKTMRVVWLGSNYPGEGEYNFDNDNEGVNAVFDTDVEIDVAVVNGGTGQLGVSSDEIRKTMPGLGPEVPAMAGRRGGSFTHFGDYSIDLFKNIGNPGSRPLYDVGAIAIAKNPKWAKVTTVGAPRVVGKSSWEERPNNARKVRFWKDFDRATVIKDFFATMKAPVLP